MPHLLKTPLHGNITSISKAWILISISSLLLAGFLSVFIMLGRIPVINEWMFGSLWMRRILVVHVDLALVVSFYSFITSFIILIPSPSSSRLRYILAIAGAIVSIFLMVGSILFTGSEAILSNYIPVIDHPMFISGLFLFGSSIVLTLFTKQLLPTRITENNHILPLNTIPLFKSAGLLIFISIILFFISWLITPSTLNMTSYYELVFWGGGHILQFANMIATVGIWLILFYEITGQNLMSLNKVSVLGFVYTAPVLFSPLLLVDGTSNSLYLSGFTQYMRWGIFPIVSIFIIYLMVKCYSMLLSKRNWLNLLRDSNFTGLILSIFLTIIGFILGAMISGSNTMVPAHYHATLGAVTIAFMAVTYWLLQRYGYNISDHRKKGLHAKQLLIYGLGQLIFVAGLAVAGTYGLARKVFGEEQLIHSAEIYFGLGLLLIGGLLAITGGIIFLWNLTALFKKK